MHLGLHRQVTVQTTESIHQRWGQPAVLLQPEETRDEASQLGLNDPVCPGGEQVVKCPSAVTWLQGSANHSRTSQYLLPPPGVRPLMYRTQLSVENSSQVHLVNTGVNN